MKNVSSQRLNLLIEEFNKKIVSLNTVSDFRYFKKEYFKIYQWFHSVKEFEEALKRLDKVALLVGPSSYKGTLENKLITSYTHSYLNLTILYFQFKETDEANKKRRSSDEESNIEIIENALYEDQKEFEKSKSIVFAQLNDIVGFLKDFLVFENSEVVQNLEKFEQELFSKDVTGIEFSFKDNRLICGKNGKLGFVQFYPGRSRSGKNTKITNSIIKKVVKSADKSVSYLEFKKNKLDLESNEFYTYRITLNKRFEDAFESGYLKIKLFFELKHPFERGNPSIQLMTESNT